MSVYNSIKLEKGMYNTTKGFTGTLETLDPSENYVGTDVEGLDAYQRQLKRFDIKVGGANSDLVEKFFKTSDSAALFPEYVARAVRQGMEENDALTSIIASKTNIDGMDYRTITSIPGEEDKSLAPVAEGAQIPQTLIKTQENLVRLQKRGRLLVASYEALRFQRLDLFTVTLKQIGAYIARKQLKDAVDVLKNGDGNTLPGGGANAAAVIATAANGTLSYADVLKLWSQLDPYELNTILASPATMTKILAVTELTNPLAGGFQQTGKMMTPLGAQLIKTTALSDGEIIGIDSKCALEMVQAGDIVLDYDKLIDRQLERAAITSIAGFAKIFPDAGKVLKIN